jgi:predicted nucleic acid-binding Zn ribbon protein
MTSVHAGVYIPDLTSETSEKQKNLGCKRRKKMRRARLVMLLVLMLVAITSFIKTQSVRADSNSSQDYTVGGTGSQCGDNGCAQKQQLRVDLPSGAQVDAVHCLTTAHYPDDSGLHEVDCMTDNAWSIFDAPRTDTYQNSVVVTTTYYNRSHNRNRTIRLTVDWH